MSSIPQIISIIPARGGSKRLPGKNIRSLAGKPLINWSIQASLATPEVHRTIVSTDDQEIADIARSAGAEVFHRNPDLAGDHSSTAPVLQEVLLSLNLQPDFIVLLQPTSPLRPLDCIQEGLGQIIRDRGDALIGVSKCKTGPEWMLRKNKGCLQLPQQNEFTHIRSQDQETCYQINGALYIYTFQALMEAEKYVWGERTLPYLIPPPYDIDIDTLNDFNIAEAIAQSNHFRWE